MKHWPPPRRADEEGSRGEYQRSFTPQTRAFSSANTACDKRFIYEESFRMPFLIRFPGVVSPGSIDSMAVTWTSRPPGSTTPGAHPQLRAGDEHAVYLRGPRTAGLAKDGLSALLDEPRPHTTTPTRIRDHRYKLIYWYNEACDTPGSQQPDFGKKTGSSLTRRKTRWSYSTATSQTSAR